MVQTLRKVQKGRLRFGSNKWKEDTPLNEGNSLERAFRGMSP